MWQVSSEPWCLWLLLHHKEVPRNNANIEGSCSTMSIIFCFTLHRDIDRGRRYSATSSGYSTTGCTDSPSSLSVSFSVAHFT